MCRLSDMSHLKRGQASAQSLCSVQSRKEKTYKRVSLYLPCVPKATARRPW